MKELIKKYKSFIMYAIFGILTTIINLICYEVLYNHIGVSNIISNIIAWIAAVAFAYITNKIWVFESKSLEIKVILPEIWKFISCRLATGVLDLIIMYIGVDILSGPSTILKIISNIIVIILNYIASKLVIFKSKKEGIKNEKI